MFNTARVTTTHKDATRNNRGSDQTTKKMTKGGHLPKTLSEMNPEGQGGHHGQKGHNHETAHTTKARQSQQGRPHRTVPKHEQESSRCSEEHHMSSAELTHTPEPLSTAERQAVIVLRQVAPYKFPLISSDHGKQKHRRHLHMGKKGRA